MPEDVGVKLRYLLLGLPTDEERREALAVAAVCSHCGEDHSEEQERRGQWTCYCIDRPRETD